MAGVRDRAGRRVAFGLGPATCRVSSDTTETPLFDRLVAFFREEEWAFEPIEGKTIGRLVFMSEHHEFECCAQALEEESIILFYSLAPFEVPRDRRVETIEFLTRVNHGLPIGNFEMDLDTNLVRYKTSIEVAADVVTTDMLRALVGSNLAVMERDLVGLRAVVFTHATPTRIAEELDS